MRFDDLYLSGVGSWFPKPVSVDKAVEAGWYDETLRKRTRQESVAVAGDDETQPEMAARAGEQAVRQSGVPVGDFRLLLHATAGFAGLDGWNVASYLQHRVLAGHGVSFEIRQQSNGAMAAIELAAAHLAAGPESGAALITAADRFEQPAWDRWRAYLGLTLGDGGSAAVLTRRPGFARVLSLVTVSRAELEGAQRADLPFRANPDLSDPAFYPVSLIERMQSFADANGGLSAIFKRMNKALVECVEGAAAEAGLTAAEADHIIFPNFGRSMLQQEVLDPLDLPVEKTLWRWAREIGHAGPTDQFGALDHLVQQGELRAGQRILLTGIGIGFNWTTAVIEILSVPPAGSDR